MQHIHLLVSGLVQGVFYRATAEQTARRLGLKGWVRNLPDGRVEAVAEGDEAAIAAFVEWCKMGPPAARVDNVETTWSQATGAFGDFTTRR